MLYSLIAIFLIALATLNVNTKLKYKLYTSSILSNSYIKLFPLIDNKNICLELQTKLEKKLINYNEDISVSVVNKFGDYIVDINGDIARIPASNQKLITTAFALDRLGPRYRLNTRLLRGKGNNFYLIGSGDPDFSKSDLYNLLDNIKNIVTKDKNEPIKLTVYEESRSVWWPRSWHSKDRKEIYGAPITRISLSSNSSLHSLSDPVKELKYNIVKYFKDNNIRFDIKIVDSVNIRKFSNYANVAEIKSAPFYALVNLSNSQSHNFTSEVILRNAFSSWDFNIISEGILSWLRFNRINTSDFVIKDGSGLSRSNRITTNGLAMLLKKMSDHKYSKYYFSSMSLYGVRGTLRDMQFNENLTSKFLGKTGTLNDVRSISGKMVVNGEPFFVSIILNNYQPDDSIVYKTLSHISLNNTCK